MEFSKKYISFSEKALAPSDKRIVLSDDFYAVGEMIDNLIAVMREK